MDPNREPDFERVQLERSLDRDHERLDSYIDLLDDVLGDKIHDVECVDAAFIQLIDEVERHFHREEAWMRTIGYPGLDSHAEQHAMLLGSLEDFRRGFLANPTRPNAFVIRTFIEEIGRAHV